MVSTKDDYQKALLKLRDEKQFRNTQYLALLRAQYAAPAHTITATELARAVGYENYNAANLHYGTLGREVAKKLGYEPPKRSNGEPMWFWTLSTGNEVVTNPDGHYEFVMRAELAQALEAMRWVK
ncbi:hypothetical protein MHM84_20350 [Halomonas sp. McH1-25]|uniref:hypothetical protein n=1 Tax=unclassified Halomonas TaxID=2609666 RepID=UPI001EF73CC7|nr:MULTISPECIES: hypothetical protein [unclassified Halomonas]MCG7602096.1 hypothetical protein [Halomonas sp. McH1-25]MCP1343012.1 hypothetical protein [Halomonas sp. FL8]MCP1362434.1 hypothetical protein [Halomonas sp. BBD45]MCP1364092.1 hypothetical protein [Halomonas sp. BBD48]